MFWLMFLLHVVLARSASPKSLPVVKPGCRPKCGDINIPFPFGIGHGCFREGFGLSCQQNATDGSYKLLSGDFEVLDIMLASHQVRMNNPISWQFLNKTTGNFTESKWEMNFTSTPFTISHVHNKFIAIGCGILAYTSMTDYKDDSYITSCASVCFKAESSVNSTCSGIGCCETPIPPGIKYYNIWFDHVNFINVWRFVGSLRSAALVEAGNFKFNTSSVNDDDSWNTRNRQVPIMMNWFISHETCKSAQRNKTNYACVSSNSVCINNQNGSGYICNCSRGYRGNPYLAEGCQDINECEDSSICLGAICMNTPGGYRCSCPPGTTRPIDGEGCYADVITGHKMPIGITIVIGAGAGAALLILVLAILVLIRGLKVRRNKKLKQMFFKQNHGLLLQRLISSTEDTAGRMKIFSLEELDKATNKFDQARILGCGGHGTVYKGILSDLRVVAIKKSKIIKQSEIDQFINEVVILSQINHRNVVKLFGCCLEAEVPLLVNEFISNGTLSDHLHVQGRNSLPWKDRLRIALETARAISYLHSAASISVFHRDIKCSNILLDDCLTAKLSDFGASRSVQIDQTGITTIIQGTYGYLDPEYYQTGRLTEKSDVYSFGVILAELLTREKPYSICMSSESGSLIARFITVVRENCLLDILDPQVVEEGPREQLEEVAVLTERCLRLRGEERSGMKEVEVRLEVISSSTRDFEHPSLQRSLSLLDQKSS
ncbi:Wall-associated kinase family protein [Rhynchospora pubera]|uniref:Wall-associated kinase family protein n=1 Tax=Rhynchospora pubera TaxID=906938 RepID=A0AAV8D1G8_9POAL|nr:Wall-associated kinase family protein [Rhynchospora pubera]